MIFRQKIFMGEARGKAIYFDVKENQVYEAPKSALLNTERETKSMAHYGTIMGIILCLPLVGRLFPGINKDVLKVTVFYKFYFPIVWILLAVGFIYLMEVALYKNIKQAKVGTRADFRYAIQTNLVNQNILKRKEVKKINIIRSWLLIIIIVTIAVVGPIMILVKWDEGFRENMAIGLVIVLSLLGILPGTAYLLLFQNNPVRWMRVVYKYQHGQIKWAKKK